MLNNILEQLDKESLFLLHQIRDLAEHAKVKVFLVGGPVRDLFLKQSTKDLDICVEGNAITLAKSFAQNYDADIFNYPAFGTSTVKFKNRHVDFASARKEKYARPGSFPKVEFSSIEEDLFRRDFTINAMAISLNAKTWGQLIDPFKGLKDLKAKRLRVLHASSFMDDPTRILRAARFKCRFDFAIEKNTWMLLKVALKQNILNAITIQRYMKEYTKIKEEVHSKKALELIKSWDVSPPALRQ